MQRCAQENWKNVYLRAINSVLAARRAAVWAASASASNEQAKINEANFRETALSLAYSLPCPSLSLLQFWNKIKWAALAKITRAALSYIAYGFH